MDIAMDLDPEEKLHKPKRIEKYVMRKAFDVEDEPYLPASVLWRQKEQFSDGVGYSWIDAIKDHAGKVVSDQQLQNAEHRFPLKTPRTKEAYLFRDLFAKNFGENGPAAETVGWQDSIACSSEVALRWDASFQGRP